MPKDKTESHERIRKAAREEFLEKGFQNASMREIGRKAGLAPSALYRHYPSKEAMFNSLLDPFVEELLTRTKEHEDNAYAQFDQSASADAMVSDNAVKLFKYLMMNHRDELRLIVCCSGGTKYETFIHDLVTMETKSTLQAFDYIRSSGVPIKPISEDEIHVLLSAYMTAVLEPIAHDWPLEKAMRCLDLVEEFFIPAWAHIMGFEKGRDA